MLVCGELRGMGDQGLQRVHDDVDFTTHCATLPHTYPISNLLTILRRFVLATDAVFAGNQMQLLESL